MPITKNLRFRGSHPPQKIRAPKGSRGRPESPLVASAEAKSSTKQKKQESIFPLPPTRNLFLVGGFVRLRADEVLSITGKYPKGAGGGQRVHVSWPPPDPPLLSSSAPLASQGRAQLGSRPSLGGPLSPSAQLIPPPAPRRRVILRVMTRYRYGSAPVQRHAPRHQGHAKCMPAPAPDWLRAPGQTKCGARCGPCRSSDKGKCPFRRKGGPGVSLGRLKGV